jgi:rRNA-processing protein FCF1
VVVVYDSTLPGDRSARTSAGGVETRFAEKDRIADEELVEMAGRLDNAVVISSDRAVRDGAEANGAVVLWSEALASWLSRS